MAIFRDCIGPTWLNEPLSLEETAARHIPSALQQTFVDLCRQPVSHYLDRCGHTSSVGRVFSWREICKQYIYIYIYIY